MNDPLDRLKALAVRRDKEGWPRCRKCKEEFLCLRNGLCGDCETPKVEPKPKEKKTGVYDRIAGAGRASSDDDRRSGEDRRTDIYD